MPPKLFISIAMATYNGEKYLRAQLESFLLQTRQPDELVISDDCSSDKTVEIIKSFATQAPFPVKLTVNKLNRGHTRNFNEAVVKTSGDIVFLSDQDDIWFSNKIAKVEQLAIEHQDYLLFMNDAALTDKELNDTGLTKLGQIYSAGLDPSVFVMGCCCAFKRKLLDLSLPIPSEYEGHDNWLVGFAEAIKVKYITPEVLQYYRRHGDNASQFIANSTQKINRLTVFKNRLVATISNNSPNKTLRLINQQEIFIEGLERAIAKNDEIYTKQLQNNLKIELKNLKLNKKRHDIRKTPLFRRIKSTLQMLLKREYTKRPVTSAIRDIFGN
jgi:glycosyltransferase involved in cell wall biosynthesis